MIDAKQAVLRAKEEAVTFFKGTAASLEEIQRESYQGREVWSITLSLARDPEAVFSFTRLSVDLSGYKRFLIDVETGELVAMLIREVQTR